MIAKIKTLVSVLFVMMFFITCKKTQSTCTDGIKNGNEEGVDCGGECSLVCNPSSAPATFVVPCAATAPLNMLKYNSTLIALPYVDCDYSSSYYYMLRSSTSALTGSSYYVYIHFYGAPATTNKIYTLTGNANFPANNNQVRVRVKVAGTWYYPTGSLYYQPNSGNYKATICNLVASPYTFLSSITCN